MEREPFDLSSDRRAIIAGVGAMLATTLTPLAAHAQTTVDVDPTFIDPKDFVPVEPFPVDKVRKLVGGTMQEVYWASLTEDERRQLLPLQLSKISVLKREASGGLTYLTASASAEKGDYQVFADYMRYRAEVISQNGVVIGRAMVGVGLRVIATLKTRKANLDLSGLLPIGIRAAAGDLAGYLESKSMGLNAPQIANLMLLPSNVDTTSISKAIESAGAIKVLVEDPKTISVPHVLAVSKQQVSNVKALVAPLMRS